jgi:tripartite-type tricarboxylate transporter receptor subunit TctC
MEKHLEGAEVRIKNVAGGSHMIGALEIFGSAPDGLTIGTFNTGMIYAQLVGDLIEPLDLRKFDWIGKAAVESRILIAGVNTPLKTVDDLRKAGRPIRFAASGLKAAAYYDTVLLSKALGIPVEIIPGFEGREAELSIMRGEVDCLFGSASALLPFVQNGFGRTVLEVGGAEGSPVPQAIDLVENDDGKMLISLIETQTRLARLTAAAPQTDPARLAELRRAYDSALSDPEFLAEATKLDLPISLMRGEDVAVAVKEALDLPPQRIEELKSLLKAK